MSTKAFVDRLLAEPAESAWSHLADHVWQLSQARPSSGEVDVVGQLDQDLASVDLLLSDSAWDLWQSFEDSLISTAQELKSRWNELDAGKAILLLDGLSLREVPWFLEGAARFGGSIVRSGVRRSELPSDTNSFARALGFPNRSALENNGGARNPHFPGARTETSDLPFGDCQKWVKNGSQSDWIFWHHWPDCRLHQLDTPGKGLTALSREAVQQLRGEELWSFIRELAKGRRVLITSDHGYAASGSFQEVSDTQGSQLKEYFRSGRFCEADDRSDISGWLPPIDLLIESRWGLHRYASGRRRWRSQGGYPTLTHGGLSLLEVLTPYFELEFSPT